MARRRRRKYTWLPVQWESLEPTEGVIFRVAGQSIEIAGPSGPEGPTFTAIPINPVDVPVESEFWAENATMADVIGSEYFLKRIVGKLFLGTRNNDDPTSSPAVLVTAGFFVARADGDNQSLPVGGQSWDDYSPQAVETIREPWIWRRSWALQNQGSEIGSGTAFRNYPTTTMEYGSVLDGPHIDARTARRITQDDRLFFGIGVHNLPIGEEAPSAGAEITVEGWLDYRLLGALRRPRQQGRF